MSITITMPALSPTMEEGALAKWLVKPGDRIEPGQVIAEIETDKATMEVEAVDEGVVSEILVAAGTQGVKVNTPIAILAGEGQASAAPPPKTPAPKPEAVAPAAKPTPQPAASSPAGGRIAASPLARRMAMQAGIDLSGLRGTGPGGRIVKADVEGALGKPRAPESAAQLPTLVAVQMPQAEARAPQSAPPPMPYPDGEYDVVPLDGMRRAIARRMTAAFRDVPHFPLTIDAEIDALLALRKQLIARTGDGGPKISVNDLLIRACALALKKVPDANASFAGDAIWKHKHAHVAVAVAIPGGLITPVVFKAETKGLAEISVEMKDLAERARARKLKPHEYEGGTFSISNLGMMGIKSFASILNEPQGMILSVGAGEQRPVVREGQVAVATLMTLTLTCDHRVVDGAVGAEFLGVLKRLLEDPMTMML